MVVLDGEHDDGDDDDPFENEHVVIVDILVVYFEYYSYVEELQVGLFLRKYLMYAVEYIIVAAVQ